MTSIDKVSSKSLSQTGLAAVVSSTIGLASGLLVEVDSDSAAVVADLVVEEVVVVDVVVVVVDVVVVVVVEVVVLVVVAMCRQRSSNSKPV